MTCSMVRPHIPVGSVLISESQYNCYGQIIMGKKEKNSKKWGKQVLGQKVDEAEYLYLKANLPNWPTLETGV